MYIEIICILAVLVQLLMIIAYVTKKDWGKFILYHSIILLCLFNVSFILVNLHNTVLEFSTLSGKVIDYLAFDAIAFSITIYFLSIIKNSNGEVDES